MKLSISKSQVLLPYQHNYRRYHSMGKSVDTLGGKFPTQSDEDFFLY